MSLLWLSLFLAEEAPLKLWKHVPIAPTPESVLYTQVSLEAVACTVEMELRVTGEVRFLSPLSCPDTLFDPVREAVSQSDNSRDRERSTSFSVIGLSTIPSSVLVMISPPVRGRRLEPAWP